MKKTLLIALFLIPVLGIAQTKKPIDGALGIKFGSTKEMVLAAMATKGAVLDKQNSVGNQLIFSNVKLGHRETEYFGVVLIDDKVYKAVFAFKAEDEPKTIEYYNSLVNDINEIYGTGSSKKIFRSPYKDGDGDEITAIQGGYADFFTDWNSGSGYILASIDSKLKVVLIYQDNVLAKEADARRKAKEKSDF